MFYTTNISSLIEVGLSCYANNYFEQLPIVSSAFKKSCEVWGTTMCEYLLGGVLALTRSGGMVSTFLSVSAGLHESNQNHSL